jgi:PPP family 3-phenylpropionic acid transporter
MSAAAAAAEARSGLVRLGFLFGTYFGTAGIFVPYFPLYLEDRGLTAAQIGIVLALGQGMRLVGPNLWGYLADRTPHRIDILRWTALAAVASFSAIFLPGGFALVLVVMFGLNFFMAAQIPVAEAIAAARLRGNPQQAGLYGRLRACGSVGFVGFVLGAGALFDAVGIGWQPYAALLLLMISAVAAYSVRDLFVPEASHERVSVRARLLEPRVRWFFLSVALMVFAHGALYSYFSLYLAQLGYSKKLIGVFWVIGVLVEIAFFATQGRVFARVPIFRLFGFPFACAALRFFLIGEFAALWAVLLIAQVLHAATFAVHHSATILMIQKWFPGAAAARGQALYASIGYGVGGTLGSLTAAALWTASGPEVVFLSGSAAALFGWWAVRRAERADRRESATPAAVSAGVK